MELALRQVLNILQGRNNISHQLALDRQLLSLLQTGNEGTKEIVSDVLYSTSKSNISWLNPWQRLFTSSAFKKKRFAPMFVEATYLVHEHMGLDQSIHPYISCYLIYSSLISFKTQLIKY